MQGTVLYSVHLHTIARRKSLSGPTQCHWDTTPFRSLLFWRPSAPPRAVITRRSHQAEFQSLSGLFSSATSEKRQFSLPPQTLSSDPSPLAGYRRWQRPPASMFRVSHNRLRHSAAAWALGSLPRRRAFCTLGIMRKTCSLTAAARFSRCSERKKLASRWAVMPGSRPELSSFPAFCLVSTLRQ